MRAIILIVLLIATSPFTAVASASPPLHAVAKTHTPVLNTADFNSVFGNSDGKGLKKDGCGQLRSLEFIAMPGTLFRIEAELISTGRKVYRVTTADYPYPSKGGYFIEPDFVAVQKEKPPERLKSLPSQQAVLAGLRAANGSRYVWGGNVAEGVTQMLDRYPASGGELSSSDRDILTMRGVDCSGLLYEATGGFTPRNTSSLVSYGSAVKIAAKSPKEIAPLLRPLDLIVWPGHVMIVIDEAKVIESRLVCSNPENGVRIRGLNEALAEIMKRRKPADSIKNGAGEFVVRRWYPPQP